MLGIKDQIFFLHRPGFEPGLRNFKSRALTFRLWCAYGIVFKNRGISKCKYVSLHVSTKKKSTLASLDLVNIGNYFCSQG